MQGAHDNEDEDDGGYYGGHGDDERRRNFPTVSGCMTGWPVRPVMRQV